jgi:hypothetical protein
MYQSCGAWPHASMVICPTTARARTSRRQASVLGNTRTTYVRRRKRSRAEDLCQHCRCRAEDLCHQKDDEPGSGRPEPGARLPAHRRVGGHRAWATGHGRRVTGAGHGRRPRVPDAPAAAAPVPVGRCGSGSRSSHRDPRQRRAGGYSRPRRAAGYRAIVLAAYGAGLRVEPRAAGRLVEDDLSALGLPIGAVASSGSSRAAWRQWCAAPMAHTSEWTGVHSTPGQARGRDDYFRPLQ